MKHTLLKGKESNLPCARRGIGLSIGGKSTEPRMILVGLTGSIGSGKSTVARMFEELGAYLIDFDILAREVVQPHCKAWKAIVGYFGSKVLNEDLTINRQRLSTIVFNEPKKLGELNQIVHPLAFEKADRRVQDIKVADPEAIIVEDIPLLIEIDRQESVDKVVVVAVSEDNQLKRLMATGYELEEARKRIRAQFPIEEKIKFADFVIDNNGSIDQTRVQVEEVFKNVIQTLDLPKGRPSD